MTNAKEATKSTSSASSSVKAVANNFKGVGTLRRRLLMTILPTVLLPLAIASAVGYIINERQIKTQTLEKLEADTLLASKTIMTFIRESFKVTDLVATNTEVIQAMKVQTKKAQEQKLPQQSIANLEKNFAATKLLTTNNSLNNYLQQIAKSHNFTEILLTEGNGFNIAASETMSDFVQHDEDWWQNTQRQGEWFEEPEFEKSVNANVISFSKAVKDPQTGKFIGVIRAGIKLTTLDSTLATYLQGHNQFYQFQIVDPDDNFVLNDIDYQDSKNKQAREQEVHEQNRDDGDDDERPEGIKVFGGESIVQTIKTLVKVKGNSLLLEEVDNTEDSLSLEEAQKLIAQQPGFSEVSLHQDEIFAETTVIASLRYQNKIYSFSTVPHTDIVSVGIVDYDAVAKTGKHLLTAFALTGMILGVISLILILLLAQQLSKPLTKLSAKTQQVAEGNLDVTASIEGTLETKTLANNFNKLVHQVKQLIQQQTEVADEQRQEKEQLEKAIYHLIEEVSDATEGDLTVRASLDSLDLSTVADLFNAIIDSLEEIAIETKQSTHQVSFSLKQNEAAIRSLAEQAITEEEETRNTLMSVEQMSQSIQIVAENASQAEKIAEDTYNTISKSTSNMDLTVNSILELRNTVGATAKKMKNLGESSQRISQVVFLIEEIALKTNVLAINASVEAGRAGEYGQGFTIVAEQVGALAAQSTAAIKEIANIVTTMQVETQAVSQAMASGITQVVESTRLVESTKQSLQAALEKSQTINQLIESISQTTISQFNTSQDVTNLMQKIANLSETKSLFSKEVAQSMVETAEVAEKLESTVAKFKVAKSV